MLKLQYTKVGASELISAIPFVEAFKYFKVNIKKNARNEIKKIRLARKILKQLNFIFN